MGQNSLKVGLFRKREEEKPDETAPDRAFYFLVACDHAAPDMAAGGRSRATTECFIPAHPRAAIAADLRD
jgi:hypothetical protein